jgi:beta-lactamase superfamily II metal-dependent hydrolase/methylphosphotriester-DNA--protein-cysteine methyltransferase
MTRFGLKQIDLMVATHAHADHIGGADEVILGTTVSNVLDSQVPNATKNYEDFLKAIKDRGAKYIGASPGQKFDLGGGAQLTILAPIPPLFTKAQLRSGANEPNANSVVTRLDYGDFSMLFTGDAEAETEARMISQGANLRAKILKVGHHGSRYATSAEFLAAVKPEAAIISVGSSNNYGHPTQETLARIKGAGATVYRTDLQGEIKITSSGKGYQITTEKTATEAALFTGRGTEKVADSATNSSQQADNNSQTVKSTQTTTNPSTTTAQSGEVVGNKNSKIYHLPGCPGYNTVSEKNRVTFKSAEEAEAAGYTRAKNCQGEGSKSEAKTTSTSKPATETKTPSVAPSKSITDTSTGNIIGNKNSKIYHLPGCPGYKTVSEKNQVIFKSAAEAEAAGYTRAKNCKGGESSTQPTSTNKSETKTVQTTPTPDVPLVTAAPAAQSTAGKIIGNKNSKKYHLPGCPSYDSVTEKNRVYFNTEEEAIKAGYTKAGNCNK